ncbi:MAG TPA: hypothetical protein VGP68_19345 [Gemmataceae bacterium]|nr:hypothetical protein [Gemmataceae bacterium]
MTFSSTSPTRFAQCPRPLAWLTVAGAIALLIWGLSVSFPPKPEPEPAPEPEAVPQSGGTDMDLYEKIIKRVHEGESYYAAAAVELPKGGYPTRSVFNWRLPTYAWFFGMLPWLRLGQALLIALCGWTYYASVRLCALEAGTLPAVAAAVWLIGALVWCVDGLSFLTQEVWASALIQLSVVSLAFGRRLRGVVAGVAALLIRELTLPYVLLCLTIALWKRRWLESLGWLPGLIIYGAFTAYHVAQVQAHMPPEEVNYPSAWLCWGGMTFVLNTLRMNQLFMLTHMSVRAFYLPFAFLGLLGWRGETGLRMLLTCLGYHAAFLAVGQTFNTYWGILLVPVLSMGAALAPWAIRDLYLQCRGKKHEPDRPSTKSEIRNPKETPMSESSRL